MTKKTQPTQKMLFWWGIILICWSAYRFIFKTDRGIFFDEFVAKPLVFLLPVIFYIKRIEKKNLLEGIWLKVTNFRQDLLLGLGVGLVFFLILFFSVPLHVILTNFNKTVTTQNIMLVILTAFVTSFSEEILSRGFVLKRLYEESNNIITSSFFASILFFFLRVPILFSSEKIVGKALLGMMITDILFSLVVSIIFLMRRSLVLPILVHAFYILSIYLLLGFS